ncbi:MAG: hypothetical protein HYY86_01805 [Candidatus Harrisonbacteria bacterium]|nr:hypothetical protein [Candidatus Harrisonbacteria bacterium]
MASKRQLILLTYALIFNFAFPNRVSGQNTKLSVETAFGNYQFPGAFLRVDKSLVTTPDNFEGSIREVRIAYALFESWSIGLQLFKVEADGYGQWARSDTSEILAANNVAGTISGRTDWDMKGAAVDFEFQPKKFWKNKVIPYLRSGVGVAELAVTFNGQFDGHETFSGFNFPVNEPAVDRVITQIPIVTSELGCHFRLTNKLLVSGSYYWNMGGHGPKGALILELF